ncbi:hypothetical protein [Fimbriiglobus ruber]|uniref:Uncharacterized protein n=1 Tax=Fimbriiglobus ruber TaxID=1908690 RepID=A0A225E7U4_9BACT|nr:hypothetical protein [Fimbriiglobus ruber]OWK44497.1 hypothetical protein FRUB_02429 [Fimbriiglobus ruber]
MGSKIVLGFGLAIGSMVAMTGEARAQYYPGNGSYSQGLVPASFSPSYPGTYSPVLSPSGFYPSYPGLSRGNSYGTGQYYYGNTSFPPSMYYGRSSSGFFYSRPSYYGRRTNWRQ